MRKNIYRIVYIVFILVAILVATLSCTDAKRAKLGGLGSKFRVDLVNCDGTITHSWISTGKVSSEQNSDGYYFNDENGDLVEVTGNLIITKL